MSTRPQGTTTRCPVMTGLLFLLNQTLSNIIPYPEPTNKTPNSPLCGKDYFLMSLEF